MPPLTTLCASHRRPTTRTWVKRTRAAPAGGTWQEGLAVAPGHRSGPGARLHGDGLWVGRGLWEALSKPLTFWVFSSPSFSSDPGHVALAGGPGGRHPQPCSTAREGPHPGPGHSHGTAERIPWLTCPREAEARLSAVPRPRRTWPPLPRAKGMSRAQRPILCPHPQNTVVWAWPRLESSVWNPTTQARSTRFMDQGGKCGRGAWAAQAGRRGPGQGQVTVALRTVRSVEGKPPKALLRCSVGPRSRKDKPGGGGAVLLHREVPAGVPARIVQNPCRMPSCGPHGADGQRPVAQGHKAYKIAEHQPRADAPRYGLG